MLSMTKKAMLLAAGLGMVWGGTASAAPVDVKVPFGDRLTGIWESREQGQQVTATKHVSTHAAPTHATKGIVKSIDASTLVITHKSKTGGEMTFALDKATHLQGSVAVGTQVDVRYREDGKTYVATAVTAQPVKPQAVHTAAPKP